MDRLVNDLLTLGLAWTRASRWRWVPSSSCRCCFDDGRRAHGHRGGSPEWPVHFWAARPIEVTGDKDRLRQVLDNLLANVRAHTPAGTTATVRVDQIGDQAQIEVRYTGPGMPDEEARRVFERFYRADPARFRVRAVGSGLGLSIVARHRGGPRRDRLGLVHARPGVGGHRADSPVGAVQKGSVTWSLLSEPPELGRPPIMTLRAASPAWTPGSTAGLHGVRRRASTPCLP